MDRADIAQRWLDLQVWCREHLGMVRFNKDPERIHARSSLWHLQGETENYYLKIYGDVEAWEREVHAYEQWVPTLGVSAPTLLGVYGSERTGGLYAILISELPGRSLQGIPIRGRALERTAALPVWQCQYGSASMAGGRRYAAETARCHRCGIISWRVISRQARFLRALPERRSCGWEFDEGPGRVCHSPDDSTPTAGRRQGLS